MIRRLALVSLVWVVSCGGSAVVRVADAGAGLDADAPTADDARADAGARADAVADADADADARVLSDAGADSALCATLAASCLGTLLAGGETCFAPSGSCMLAAADGGTSSVCWANGARFRTDPGGNVVWTAGATGCVHGSRLVRDGSTELSLILDTAPGAPLYFYVVETGQAVCEGAGTASLDPAVAGCPLFRALLAPDISACTAGSCP